MRVQTILHPTDHREESDAALRYAVALAHDYGAKLLILHVLPGFGLGDPFDPTRTTSTASGQAKSCIEYLMAEGDVVTTTLRTASERKCDLIVLGSRPDRGWRRWVQCSQAERIVRDAPCPVLIVREAMTPPCGNRGPTPSLPLSSAG